LKGLKKKKLKFRSKFEKTIAEQLTKGGVKYEYENLRIPYTKPAIPSTYIPDFIITTKSGKEIIIEVKGLWDYQDRFKHLLIKRKYGKKLDIRFLFYNSKQRIRKGSKTTYRDICDGNGRAPFKGVTWKYADKTIPKEWLEE